MSKCNHRSFDKVKGSNVPVRCDKCGKTVIKGKHTPNKAHGR